MKKLMCLSGSPLPLNINAKVIQRLKCHADVSVGDEAIPRNPGLTEQVVLQRFNRHSTGTLGAL